MEKTQNSQIYSQFFTVLQCKTVVRSSVLQIIQNPAKNTIILMYLYPSMEKTQYCQIYSQFFTVLQRKTVVRSCVLQIFKNPTQNTIILMYIYPRKEQNSKSALKSTY